MWEVVVGPRASPGGERVPTVSLWEGVTQPKDPGGPAQPLNGQT